MKRTPAEKRIADEQEQFRRDLHDEVNKGLRLSPHIVTMHFDKPTDQTSVWTNSE